MRNVSKVKQYADHALYITWVKLRECELECVWTYLCKELEGVEYPHYLWATLVPVNLPWPLDEKERL